MKIRKEIMRPMVEQAFQYGTRSKRGFAIVKSGLDMIFQQAKSERIKLPSEYKKRVVMGKDTKGKGKDKGEEETQDGAASSPGTKRPADAMNENGDGDQGKGDAIKKRKLEMRMHETIQI